MQKDLTTMPGYKINEYSLVLTPHEELRNRLMQVRKEFNEKYNAYSFRMNTMSRPHLLIARFKQLEMMEERITNRIKTVAMGFKPFKVELKDFGSLPTHTIFIQANTKDAIRSLVKQLKSEQRVMKINDDNKPYFIDDPMIPVAQKISAAQYEKAWPEYSQRHFAAKFIADSMLLIKRRAGEKTWQIAEKLPFMNLPVVTRQGELFLGA